MSGWTIRKTDQWRIDAFKLWCWRTLESPLHIKETKPVNPKWNQSWIFVGRSDAKPEAPIVWLPYVKSWLIGKHADAGKDRGQEEKGMTENEMIGWLHLLSGYEFEQTLRDSGQESLVHGVTKSWTQLSHWTTKEQLSKVCVLCQTWTYSLGENKIFILIDKMAILPKISRVAVDKCWLSLPTPLLSLLFPFSWHLHEIYLSSFPPFL